MKILLPVDGSEPSRRMLAYLAVHPELLPGEHTFTAFTAVDPRDPFPTRLAGAVSMERFLDEQAEYVLGPVRALARQQGWHLDTDHVPGPAVQAIVEKAEVLRPDMIVMGTRGRSPLRNLVLGSVASGVLANCRVPVLMIR